jgi:hypothetical protein
MCSCLGWGSAPHRTTGISFIERKKKRRGWEWEFLHFRCKFGELRVAARSRILLPEDMTRTKMEMAVLGLVENPDPDPLLPSSSSKLKDKPGSRQEGEEGESGSAAGRPQRLYRRAVKRELRCKASVSALAMVIATAFFLGSPGTHGLVPSVLLRCRGLERSRFRATRLTCSSTQGGGGGGGGVGDDNSPPRKPPRTLSIVKNGIETPQFSDPKDIPPFLMEALKLNDFPEMDSGLRAAWDLGGDTTKFIFL